MRRPVVLLVKSRSFAIKTKGVSPPLGLLYLAAYLRKYLSADVRIVDATFEADPLKAVQDAVRERAPDVIGISALTGEAFTAHRIAAAVKAERPDLPVILGGPHASCDPALAMQDPNVDAAVIGEGEETFSELVRVIVDEGPRWRELKTLRAVAGLAFRGDATEITAARPPIHDLDALPFPAWDLIDYRRYWTRSSMASIGVRPYMTMFTSRGCPYRCVFCHNMFGKTFRARSPENVADEVAEIHRLGAGDIEVLDDIANFRRERFDRMLEVLLERNLHPVLSFSSGIRADILHEESLGLLKRVGVGEISVAIETASARLQRLIRKDLDLERARRLIDAMADLRIFSRGFFLLGLPTETVSEMRATIRFAHTSRLHMALFITPNPYRNTELFQMFVKVGKLPADVRTADYGFYGSPFNGSDVPDPLYRQLYRWAYYGFYLNPSRMLRIARDRPHRSDFPVRAYALFRNVVSFRRVKDN